MEKDYDKRVFHNIRFYNRDEIEAFLNKMALEGFYLLEMTKYQMFFKKDKPSKVRYSLVLPEKKEDYPWYNEYGKKIGWELMFESDACQIYMNRNVQAEEIETQAAKFDTTKKVRDRVLLFCVIKMVMMLLVIYLSVLFTHGLMIGLLSDIGLFVGLFAIFYELLLFFEIVDILWWRKSSERNRIEGKTIVFRYNWFIRKIRNVLLVLLGICSIMLIYTAASQWITSIREDGWKQSTPIFVVIFAYTVTNIFFTETRGKLSKQGRVEKVVGQCVLVFIIYILVLGITNIPKGEHSILEPEYFSIDYKEASSIRISEHTKGLLGGSEFLQFDGQNNGGQSSGEYSYYLYESKVDWLMKPIYSEVIREEKLKKYLTDYNLSKNYKIYTALKPTDSFDNQLGGNSHLAYYDACIVISGENKLIVFYYKDFNKRSEASIIGILEEKLFK